MDVSGTWLLRRPQQACLESKHRAPRFPAVTNISFPNTTFTRSLFWNTNTCVQDVIEQEVPLQHVPRIRRKHITKWNNKRQHIPWEDSKGAVPMQKVPKLKFVNEMAIKGPGKQPEEKVWEPKAAQDDLFQGFRQRLSQGHVPSIRNVVVSQERDLPTPMPSRGWWMVLACFGTKPGRNMFCFVWIARLSPMCSVWTMRRHLGTCLRSGAVSYCFAPWKN